MQTLGYGSSESCIDTQLKGWSSNSSMVTYRPVVELGVKGSLYKSGIINVLS